VPQESADAQIVLAVIRGQVPLSTLAQAGVSFDFQADPGQESMEIRVIQKRRFEVRPDIRDIASGLLRYAADQDARSVWASLLLAADWIAFEPLEREPDWDCLLDGIWDASFRLDVNEAAVQAAHRVQADKVR
jgi:hypothetical protein